MMTILPRRRQPARSGIERAERRLWTRHRAFLRRHHCVVSGCEREPIEVSHIRSAANAGTGIKPHDQYAVPMCGGLGRDSHHAEYHRIGHISFSAKYGLDLWALAAAFTKASPDTAMKEALKLVPHTVG